VSRLLIRNGRVVDPSQGLDEGMDLLLDDGHVAALGERLDGPPGVEEMDASGLVVAPGFIDLHCHLREPGLEYKETIASGCAAAVAGGFTAVCCMPTTQPANDDPSVTRFIRDRATVVGLARVYPIGAVSKGRDGVELAEIGEMVREGAVAVSEGGRTIRNALLMRRALEYARSFDVPVAVHAQDPDLVDDGAMHEGAVSTRIGLRGAPAAAEQVIVARDMLLSELTGGRLHVCHVSSRGALDLVRMAKRRRLAVTCEAATPHFTLTDADVAASNYDPNFKLDPPLRGADDVEAVLQAIYDGTVDAIVSDHAPHHQDEKDLDFADAPFGVVGLETVVSVAIDRLVHGRVVGLMQLVRLLSTGPAQSFGLPGGSLKVGSPGDVTLLDLRTRRTVDPKAFRSRSRNTPFAGRTLQGGPAATVVGGRVVWRADGRG
jgi:dihydroorotase